ncbi:MmcQ/YjbR family DNA-binding protein [Actinomadura sp. GTD37]|uniref:MmcQ/YjbR family DNA-binding protein n=1 Tax=Actinomadura sp. GTD37 TaxID=1778030 RepID=UPI0035C1027A
MSVELFLEVAHGLPEVAENESFGGMTSFRVRGKSFGYLNEAEETAMLKATRDEQAALVAEAPDVFSPSWASGRFAWVNVNLREVDADELAELTTEAWRLSAPKRLAAAQGFGGQEDSGQGFSGQGFSGQGFSGQGSGADR